jgi:uncharacterized protein (TIRG00374 family)
MTKSARRTSARILLVLFSVALLFVTVRSVSFAAIVDVLLDLRPRDILLIIVANAMVILTFSGRWWLFLAGQGYRLPYVRLVGYRLAAFGVSYFTPGPHFGGEPLQVYLVTERDDVPADSSIAAVTMDKLIELLANFTFMLGGLIIVLQRGLLSGSLGNQALIYALLLLLLPVSMLIALWNGYHPLSGLLQIVTARWPSATLNRWYSTLRRSEDLIAQLCRHRPGILVAASAVSALSWIALIGEYWLMTRLLGINLTFGQAIMALIAARFAILLPMPAGLGALEASQAIAMSLLGMDPASGVALALLIRTRDVILGLLGLWLGGASAWRIATQKDLVKSEAFNSETYNTEKSEHAVSAPVPVVTPEQQAPIS